MLTPQPERTIIVGRGKKARPFRIRVAYAEHPDPMAWARVEGALLRYALPMAREIIERDRAAKVGEVGIPEAQP